jgi:acetyl-CoA C-acetyltransferase
VPEDRWVFPLAGADANDHWFISHRPELHRSPAIRLAGAAALELAGVGIDDVGPIDLYSCFPCVVQMAAHELGLPADDPARSLTLTGGLTFGGGPGNNYASHGIAQAVGALRTEPGSVGMATGLGWYATKHSIGLYASRPPSHKGHQPFAWRNVQDEVDALPQCRVDSGATGAVRVETYTVAFDRDGNPERGILACRTADDSRAWSNITDADTLASLCATEGIGRTGSLAADGLLSLDD